jgi:hypothetical protein
MQYISYTFTECTRDLHLPWLRGSYLTPFGVHSCFPLFAAMMAKLASALSFICGPDHPCTLALKKAAESKAPADVKKAHAQFKKLEHSKRAAALNMLR